MTKTLIAAAAVAAALTAAAPAPQAQAKTDVDVNISIGGGYHHGWYKPAVSCRTGARVVQRDGFWGVYPVDCALPGYKYVGWRWGKQYVISVNAYGYITNVRRAY